LIKIAKETLKLLQENLIRLKCKLLLEIGICGKMKLINILYLELALDGTVAAKT